MSAVAVLRCQEKAANLHLSWLIFRARCHRLSAEAMSPAKGRRLVSAHAKAESHEKDPRLTAPLPVDETNMETDCSVQSPAVQSLHRYCVCYR